MTGVSPELPPRPPSDLPRREPIEVHLKPGDFLHRFFTASFEPVYFDTGLDGRLNSPDGSYGVLYAAKSERGAFAETFLREPGRTLLPSDLITRKAYVILEVISPLKLVRMAGAGLARIGATAQVVHGGKPYNCPQAWSASLHGHSGLYDGIAYNARHDDEELCYAIFERAAGALRESKRVVGLDQEWFWELCEVYRVGLAPSA